MIHLASESEVTTDIITSWPLRVTPPIPSGHLSRSISNPAMAELAPQIPSKATWHGVKVRVADLFVWGQQRGYRPRPQCGHHPGPLAALGAHAQETSGTSECLVSRKSLIT